MLMNHQTRCSLLCDWMLYQIGEDCMTNLKEKSTGLGDYFRPPYLYLSSSKNQQSLPWFNNIFE